MTAYTMKNRSQIMDDVNEDGLPSDLPARYNQEIGNMHLLKGKDHTATKQIITWEMVKVCRAELCDAYGLCEYGDAGHRKCRVETTYLRTVSLVLYRNFASELDEPTMMRVGLHLRVLMQNLHLWCVSVGRYLRGHCSVTSAFVQRGT